MPSKKGRWPQLPRVPRTRVPLRPTSIDPRSDPLYGDFDKAAFEDQYGFLSELKEREKATLEEMMSTEKDPEVQENMKFLLERMKNREAAKEQRKKKELMEKERQDAVIAIMKKGQRPVYYKKSGIRINRLAKQCEELKESSKLEKYLAKKRKNAQTEDHKRDCALFEGILRVSRSVPG